jgi:hypothetical protein
MSYRHLLLKLIVFKSLGNNFTTYFDGGARVYLIIVDDEKEIRDGLSSIPWESMGLKLMGCCTHGLEALHFISELHNTCNLYFMHFLHQNRVNHTKWSYAILQSIILD